jgi:PAS domain-containing protein
MGVRLLTNLLKRRTPLGRPTVLHRSIMPVLILSLSFLASLLGLFAILDALWFATVVRWPPQQPAPMEVVIVDLPADSSQAGALLPVQLRALGARATLPVALPGEAGCTPEIIAGQALRYPNTFAACERLTAAAGIASAVGARLSPDFSMATSTTIPRLDLAHLQDPAFVSEIVRGKTVLLARQQRQPLYVTPMYRRDGAISAATLDALMVESMRRGRVLRWAPAVAEFAVCTLFFSLLLWWGRRQPGPFPLLRPVLVAVCALSISALLLHLGHVVVPIGSTLAALGGAALLQSLRERRSLAGRLHALEVVLQQAMHRSDRDEWRAVFDDAQPMWGQFNALALEHFGATRSAMLALPPGEIDLVVADLRPAEGCIIVEAQRDHRLAPYDHALAQARPAILAGAFFAPATADVALRGSELRASDAQTLIVALSYAGETFGFWALEIDAQTRADAPLLLEEIKVYADAFARTLHRARHARQQQRLPFPGAPLLESLGEEAAMQIAAYRSLYAASRHPSAMLDPHGQIQFSNAAFGQLAKASQQPLLSMSLQQMLTSLCSLSQSQARGTIRSIIANRRSLAHPVTPTRLPMPMTLHAYPVAREAGRSSGTNEPGTHLDLLGIVLELVQADATGARISGLGEACERMVATTERALDEALLTLQRQPSALSGSAQSLESYLHSARSSLADFEQVLRMERHQDDDARRRCDVRVMLDLALHDAYQPLSERRISCNIEGAAAALTAISPDATRALLGDALALLIQDAVPDSALRCELERTQGSTELRMRNQGFGVPGWHLKEARAHADTPAGDDLLRRLLAHTSGLEAAGARLLVDSRLGEGYELLIEFPTAD